MKNVIFGAFALAAIAGSASASVTEFNGGALQQRAQFTIGQSGSLPVTRVGPTVYSNITNFSGFTVSNGGATSITAANGTLSVADNINATSGGTIDTFTFSVANSNSVPVTARPRVRFYAADGVGGAPGTVLGGFSFNPITFTANNVALFTGSVAASNVVIPANFWASIFFDGSTASPAPTVAQLNLLGQGLFDPPTLGTSTDVDFLSTLTGGSNSLINNPTGAVRTAPFVGAVANYGWEFTVVPAPASASLLCLGGLLAARRRRA